MQSGHSAGSLGRQRKLEGASERNIELRIAAGTVDDHRNADHFPAHAADEIDRLLDPATLGDHVLGDEDLLPRLDRKTALQDQPAVLLVRENRADSERTATSWPTIRPPTAGEITVSIPCPRN